MRLAALSLLKLICDDHQGRVLAPLEELAEERFRPRPVPQALHGIEAMTILINRPPEVMPLAMNRETHFIEVPLISRFGAAMPQLIRIPLALTLWHH